MIRIKVLGTSGTFPTEERNHISIFLEYFDRGILFDCGEGTQKQMRISKIPVTKIDYILISHWHGDHILGLAGILFNLSNSNYNKELNIVIPKNYKKKIRELIDVYNIPIEFKLNIIEAKEGKIINEKDFEVYGFELKHTIETFGYIFKEKDKIKLEKEKIKDIRDINIIKKLKRGEEVEINGKKYSYKDFGYIKKGLKISYVVDTLYFDKIIDNIKESDFLFMESTFFNDINSALEHYHLDYTQSKDIFEKSKSKILFLLHYSQRYKNEDIIKYSDPKNNIFTLFDFDEIRLTRSIIEIENMKNIYKYYRDEKTGEIKLFS